MDNSITLNFRDALTSENIYFFLRHTDDGVALCLSQETNGDLEVVIAKSDVKELITALSKTVQNDK